MSYLSSPRPPHPPPPGRIAIDGAHSIVLDTPSASMVFVQEILHPQQTPTYWSFPLLLCQADLLCSHPWHCHIFPYLNLPLVWKQVMWIGHLGVFNYPSIDWLIHAFSVSFIFSLTHSFIRSFIHDFIHVFIHICMFIHNFIHSFIFVRSFMI